MAKVWKDKKSCYYDQGRRCYRYGDTIPDEIVEAMGESTAKEYEERGLMGNSDKKSDKEEFEAKRQELLEKAKAMGLSPHPSTGIPKLEAAIADAEALAELKKEALALGIDPRDDVTYEELRELVDEVKSE